MADAVTLVETGATAVAATVALFGIFWKPLTKRFLKRKADDLFLHGSDAVPGIRGALVPAASRLENVEVVVQETKHEVLLTNEKIDKTNEKVDALHSTVKGLSKNVETILSEVKQDTGATLRDVTDRIETEQTRVAEEHKEENK